MLWPISVEKILFDYFRELGEPMMVAGCSFILEFDDPNIWTLFTNEQLSQSPSFLQSHTSQTPRQQTI